MSTSYAPKYTENDFIVNDYITEELDNKELFSKIKVR